MGGFNVKIEVRSINENIKYMGLIGAGNRNERGEILLDFAEGSNLIVTNSLFLKAANRYCTWEAPGGVIKTNLISYCLQIGRLWGTCEVITKVDIIVVTGWSEQE